MVELVAEHPVFDMLAAVRPAKRAFHIDEEHVLDSRGKSHDISLRAEVTLRLLAGRMTNTWISFAEDV